MKRTAQPARPADGKLGTFLGVFLPTILTILGVIMYLRLGWVAGQVGLGGTLLIVVLANAITLITTLSFSAIATNIRVGVGGAYYIISRSLGLELGGAIGLPLFLSQAFSVTLYAYGLAESFRLVWPDLSIQPVALGVVAGVGLLAFRGAGLALKVQIPLLVLIGLSLAALAVGVFTRPAADPIDADAAIAAVAATPSVEFWAVFAVFFPAVTGIMAGLGLSGDLRDPLRAIPRGALAAMLAGFAVYLAVPFLLVRAATSEALIGEPLIWTRIAALGSLLVLPGLWGAIFSSAIGSVLGAPRTLQAMAMDRLAPALLARKSKGGEPLAGLVVTLAIALAAVALGDLNAVAPVVSMFFLTVYGMVNLVAALETLSGDPSWRPRLRVPWYVCLAGGIACFAVMFLISPGAAVAAIVIELGLWALLARRERRAGWGDVRRGVYESLIRWSLVKLADRPITARNWRPHVMVFVDDVERRLDLIRFGNWFSQGRGVVTVCELIVGDLLGDRIPIVDKTRRVQQVLDRQQLVAFGEVDVVRDVISGITEVAQANGIAGMDSNTILLGWPREVPRITEFLQIVERLERLNKSVVIGRIEPDFKMGPSSQRKIHIWWGGLQNNGDLMLLLAHLLTCNAEWRQAEIHLLSVASSELMRQRTEHYLARLLPEIRISVKATVMLHPKDRSVHEIIGEKSAEADVVFLGLRIPERQETLSDYAERLRELCAPLRTVFFVKNSSLFVGKLIQTTDELAEVLPDQQEAKPPDDVDSAARNP